MPNYDFSKCLDPISFEYFAKDMIEIREKASFEIFGEGTDNGIDLRNIKENSITIVQVKRYSGFSSLYQQLEKVELEKVKKLNPDRYILVTSVTMTVKRKERIKELLKDYIKNEADIIGKEQLNSLLGKPEYKEIEEKYYQLWMNSTNVLENIIDRQINHDIYTMSKSELEKIKKSTQIYVSNEDFEKAIRKIKQHNCILISGEPGIGKTTLAHNLCAYLLNKNRDSQFIFLTNISDIFRLYQEEKEQIFFVDDFWGIKFDGNLRGDEENKLKKAIEMIAESRNKILVLTSREYILTQGYAEYPELEEFFDQYKYNIYLSNYSDLFKARILFKHLQNSELEYRAVYQIAQGYEWIINNENYSPRIIENYIQYLSKNEIEVTDYRTDFIKYLDNPHKIWKEVFQKQSEGAQLIAILILLFNEPIDLQDVKALFFFCLDHNTRINARKKDFQKYITQLENTIITTYEDKMYSYNCTFVKIKNSSLELYLFQYFQENLLEEYIQTIIDSTTLFNSLMILSGNWKALEYRDFRFSIPTQYKESIVDKMINEFEELTFKDESIYFETYREDEKQVVDKLVKVIYFYKQYRSERLKAFIIQKTKEVLKDLATNPYVEYEDMFAIPHLIRDCIEQRIYWDFNGKKIINDFFKAVRFVKQIRLLDEFEGIFPNEYKEFQEKNRVKIVEKIVNLSLEDAEFFMSDGMEAEVDDLIDIVIPELFEKYTIPYEKWYMNEFYEITDHRLIADKRGKKKAKNINITIDEEEEEHSIERKEEKEKKIIEREKEQLLNEYFHEWDETFDEIAYIKQKVENRVLRRQIQQVACDYEKNYVREFFEDEDGAELAIAYIQNKGKVDNNAKDYFKGLIEYIQINMPILTEEVFTRLQQLAYQTFQEGRRYFKEKEIEENFSEKIIEKFIKAKLIFCYEGKYQLQTINFHLYFAFCQMIQEKESLEKIYTNEDSYGDFKDLFNDLCYVYSDIDLERFNLDFFLPQLKRFIQKIEAEEGQQRVISFMKFFEIDVDFTIERTLEIDGYSVQDSVILMALEYMGYDIWDMLEVPAKKINSVKKLLKVVYPNNIGDIFHIDFKEDMLVPEKYKVFEEMGIISYLDCLYKYIKKVVEMIENGQTAKNYRYGF